MPGQPRARAAAALSGLTAHGAPERLLARIGRAAFGLGLSLLVAGVVVASGAFAWGVARTLQGDVIPKLLALLVLVVGARLLRSARPVPLLARPDPGAAWRERVGALAEGALVLVAVATALHQAWVFVQRLIGD